MALVCGFGSLADATVPLERLLALSVVRLAPEPLNVPAVSVSVVLL
jgi:hypothetical protein